MILHRFCSISEYDLYQSGASLLNDRDHYNGGHGGSVSVGFCFFEGDPHEWAHRLNGLVDFDVLLTVEVDPVLVLRSMGVYADWSRDNGRDPPPRALFREYCSTRYDNKTFKFISADFFFKENQNFYSRSEFLAYCLSHGIDLVARK